VSVARAHLWIVLSKGEWVCDWISKMLTERPELAGKGGEGWGSGEGLGLGIGISIGPWAWEEEGCRGGGYQRPVIVEPRDTGPDRPGFTSRLC
jgi:hypothetical protein